jgi:hypothetical protein
MNHPRGRDHSSQVLGQIAPVLRIDLQANQDGWQILGGYGTSFVFSENASPQVDQFEIIREVEK